jgi:hypothetical protein
MRYIAIAVTIAVAIWAVFGPPPPEPHPALKQVASRR